MKINYNAFESEYLSIKSGNILLSASEFDTLNHSLLCELISIAAREEYNLVSLRVPENYTKLLGDIEKTQFQYVEKLLTFSKNISESSVMDPRVKVAASSHLEEIGKLGHEAFTFDRFHADQSIDNARADKLKEAWAMNCLKHRADPVLIYQGEDVEAFSGCIAKNKNVSIDLIAVGKKFQGRGVGRALLSSCEGYFAKTHNIIQASTQSTNVSSIALYKSCGFKLISKQITFHLVMK